MIRTLKTHSGFLAVWLVVFLSHSLLAVVPPLFSDEAMFWEWSRHPAFGYYAHPPMTGWLIGLVTAVFGTFQYTVRLTSILLHLGTIGLVYAMALEVARDKRLAVLSAVLYASLPMSLFLGTAITTDSPLIFFFTAATVFVRKAIIEQRDGFWYLAAVACGGMMLSKFMAVLFFPGVFFFLLLHPGYRGRLLTPQPYLAFLLSMLLFSPFLIWNMNNQWLTFQFNLYQRQKDQGFDLERPFIYLGGQLLAASPLVFGLLVAALAILLYRFIRGQRAATATTDYRDSLLLLLSITTFPFLFYIPVSFLADVGAHYTAIVYPVAAFLIVIWLRSTGVNLEERMRPRMRWAYGTALAVSGLSSLAIFVLICFPTLLPDRMLYTEAVNDDAPVASHYFGWHDGGAHIAEVMEEWRDRPEGLFMTSKDYGLASMLGFYTPGRPQYYLMNVDTKVIHGKSFLLWEKGKKPIGANTIYVSDTPRSYQSRLNGFFKRIQHLPPFIVRDDQGRILRIFYIAVGVHYLGGEPDNLSLW